MWLCPRCHTENKDGFTVCEGCGATRSAGRFGSGVTQQENRQPSGTYKPPVLSTPRTQTAPSGTAAQGKASEPVTGSDYPGIKAYAQRGGGLLAVIGTLLAILLPALCILISIRQYDVLSPILTSLLFGPDPQPDIVSLSVYVTVVFTATLLLLLPGAWALSQSRLHARLSRMDRKL